MARFHPLRVTEIAKTTRDAVVVSLQPEDGADFGFLPGQYLTFRTELEGTELRRSYSICAGRPEGRLQVGIKRVAGGAFSTWANETLAVGDVIEAMPPMGTFHTPLSAGAEKHYLGFAGGSGITPVLSILRSVLAEEPKSRFTLVYANRGINSIMFREELEDLKNLHMGRVNLIHVLEADAQDIDLFRGRVDAEKCAALFSGVIDLGSVDMAFICGPEPMMLAISASLQEHGLAKDRIKFELFASAQPGRLAQKAASSEDAGEDVAVTVTLDGAERHLTMGRTLSLLEAALENAVDAPFSCRAGVCSTCMCRLEEGEVEMRANHALEDYEVRRGFILSCQAYPVTDKIKITYDVSGHGA